MSASESRERGESPEASLGAPGSAGVSPERSERSPTLLATWESWPGGLQLLPLIALVFAAGAAIGTSGGRAVPVGIALAAIGTTWAIGFALAATIRSWRAWVGVAIGFLVAGLGIVLAAGCWWADARLPRPQAGDLVHMAPLRLVRIVARVDTDPVWAGDRWRFEARPVRALFPRSRETTGRVAVTWRAGHAAVPWGAGPKRAPPVAVNEPARLGMGPVRPRFGDLVLVTGSLRGIESPSNPGQPDYRSWAARRGVFARLRADRLALLAPGDEPWNVVRLAGDVKERAVAIIGRGLPERDAALAGSLLFGAGAVPVDDETRQTFTDLGLAHILAASGMQTTLLVSLTLGIGRAAGLSPWPRSLAAAGLATFFAAMCGFAPSIMRATWMSGAALLAEATGRQALGTRTLWLSALAMLLSAPCLVVDIGFQFSFLATYGLLTTGASLRRWAHGAIVARLGCAAGAGPGGDRVAGPGGDRVAGPGGDRVAGAGGDRVAGAGGDRAAGGVRRAGDGGPGWLGVLVDGFSAPVAAFIWCTPLQLVLFGRLSVWSLPANWFAEGFVVFLTYAGFLLAGAGLAWEVLAAPAPWVLGPLLCGMQGGLDLIHKLPGSAFGVQAPPGWTAGAVYALLGLSRALGRLPVPGLASGGSPAPPVLNRLPEGSAASTGSSIVPPAPGFLTGRHLASTACPAAPRAGWWRCFAPKTATGWPLVLAVGILAAGSAAAQAPPQALEVTVLDIGQGDAVIVRAPGGGCGLVDAGPADDHWDAGKRIVLPALGHLGCRDLDLAVVTHPHADHLGGMAAVLAALPVREVWDAGQPNEGDAYAALLAGVLGSGAELCVPRPGRRRLAGGVEWQVVGPDPRHLAGTRSDPNNNSLVIRLRYGATRMLLTGDLEAEGERALLARAPPELLAADLLKTPHHGSRFGSTPEFLAAVRPTASVVSVGRDNRFGHPDPAALARLTSCGPVYRTDRDGAVTFRIEPSTWSVSVWLPP